MDERTGYGDSGHPAWRSTASLGELLSSRDWTSTTLGPLHTWPDNLRTVVDVLLANPVPMAVFWGREAVLIYNHAYADVLGARHPNALGRPACEVFSGIEPAAGQDEGMLGQLQRCVGAEAFGPAQWTVSWSPIRDESGKLAGVLSILTQNAARDTFILRLSDALQPLNDPVQIERTAARCVRQRLDASHAEYAEIADGKKPAWLCDGEPVARLQRGEPLIINDVTSDPALTDADRRMFTNAQAASCIIVSVVNAGRWIAVFRADSTTPRAWSAAEITLLQETAQRTWAAMERARSQQTIQAALAGKDPPLRQMSHLFRNSLQLIASLINLQASQSEDSQVLNLFDATRARVHSIATIYDLILRSHERTSIDTTAYARQLVPELLLLHDADGRVQVRIEGSGATLELERAMPFGLLLNELLSNACRHAFPEHRPGEVTVRLERENSDEIVIVSDNGVGLPPGLDFHQATSLGLMLVHMLTQQLGGTVDVIPVSGTCVRVRFPSLQC